MSLTSILSYSNKQYADFRSLLDELFPTPKFRRDKTNFSEPLTTNYALIGIAFDYLLRFSLERKYKGMVFGTSWIAEDALSRLQSSGLSFFGNPDDIDFDNIEKLMAEKEQSNQIALAKFDNCKKIYSEFLNSSDGMPEDLIEASLYLSRLDLLIRDPRNQLNSVSENPLDIKDLRQLMENCDLDQFKPTKKIILNPTFGAGSKLVGGADADLIIDNTLIDIKTTKDIKITRPIFNQIIGYYMLHLIGGIDNYKDIIIDHIGIYFSRYNILWKVPIAEIGTRDEFDKAIHKLKASK